MYCHYYQEDNYEPLKAAAAAHMLLLLQHCMDTQTEWQVMYVTTIHPSEAVFILSKQTNPLPRKLLHQSQKCRSQGS